jgi:hypothetical protein
MYLQGTSLISETNGEIQEISSILWNPEDYYGVLKSPQ